MKKPDLHLHSTASDGVLAPHELIQRAAELGLTHAAITDHDTMAGYDSLQGKSLPLTLIPGVELSVRDTAGLTNVHLLGYGFGKAVRLRETLAYLADRRVVRAELMIDKLAQLGMPLPKEELMASCAGSIGRPHIARAMVSAGYVSNVREAFERYIGSRKPAYYPNERLGIHEAIALLREEGFLPVLAHPREMGISDQRLRDLLEAWKKAGLMGMEVYHPSAAGRGFARLDSMARSMDLLVTGGSDFHQEHDKHGMIGAMVPHWTRADEDLDQLLETMEKHRLP